jgi:hypothetical protein
MPEVRILSQAAVTGDVAAAHKERFGRAFRRIGRYVKLAQLGGAACAGDLEPALRREMGIYLGTGIGNAADIVPLAQGILDPVRPRTSPMAFAGCVGNAAAFFVARALDVFGPNVTVSQEELSFEGALMEGVLALRSGRVRHALVGGVTVLSGDGATQRSRIDALDVVGEVGEGAAFLLLGLGDSGPLLSEVWLGRASEMRQGLGQREQVLPGWRLAELPGAETRLLPVATGLRLVELLESGARGDFVHLQRSRAGLAGRVRVRL